MTIYDEIIAERARQDAKWGEQNWPSVDSNEYLRGSWKSKEEIAKILCEAHLKNGSVTFLHIAEEEFCEVAAAPDDVARRAELVQLAAVCVQWIEAIDRRAAK